MLNTFHFRHLTAVLTLACAFACGLHAGIKEVVTEYRTEQDFKRIREYFTGDEFTGRRLVVRSQADERAGCYFVLTMQEPVRKLPTDAKVRIAVVLSGDEQPAVYDLPLPEERPAGREIFAGLTGTDWADPEARPMAWRVALIDSAGNETSHRNSYLWKYEP